MEPWLRGLLDLRDVFKARAGDDLNYLTAHKTLSPDEWAETGGDEDALKGILASPDEDEWREGKPVLFEGVSYRAQTLEEMKTSGETRQQSLIRRHVLFGDFADGDAASASVKDFTRWAGNAGLSYLAWPGRSSSGEAILRIEPNWLVWLNSMVGLARRNFKGCQLSDSRRQPLEGRDCFRLTFPCNVFIASNAAIDFLDDHKGNPDFGRTKPTLKLVGADEPVVPDAASAPTTEGVNEPRTVEPAPDPEKVLADSLRAKRKPALKQALLVEFMVDRDNATYFDVIAAVYDHEETDEKAIRSNCGRVNEEANALGLKIKYRASGGWVTKEVSLIPQ